MTLLGLLAVALVLAGAIALVHLIIVAVKGPPPSADPERRPDTGKGIAVALFLLVIGSSVATP